MNGRTRYRIGGQAWSGAVLIAMALQLTGMARAAEIGDPKPAPVAVRPDSSAVPNGRLPAMTHPVRTGARAGAIAGGIVGAGLFLVAGAFAEGLCEYDCGAPGAPGYVALGVVGGALGAGAGALIGAFLGSTVRPTAVPPKARPTTPARSPDDEIGSITILGGYAGVGGKAVFSEQGDVTQHAARNGGGLVQFRYLSHRGDWARVVAPAGLPILRARGALPWHAPDRHRGRQPHVRPARGDDPFRLVTCRSIDRIR